MRRKNGFTLIELLAVIIILGVIMLIAIPSVTRYINESRKDTYIDTARQIVKGAVTLVNSGELDMYDTNITYYIPASCIPTENSMSSPFGEFEQAYVIVGYTGSGYLYYWASTDTAHQGITMKEYNKLTKNDVKPNTESIDTTIGIGTRTSIKILDKESCQTFELSEGNNSTNIVCKPATTLHTARCNRTDTYGCNATGQAGYGNTITYGTLVSGTPKSGDAYDCKLTKNGDYTERFYYVTSDEDNSVLIYYKNVNGSNTYAYDSSEENFHGPRTAYQYLPSTTEWDNPGLIQPGTRNIIAQNGSGSTSGGTIEPFTYTNKVARLLTAQEVNSACGITVGDMIHGELDECTWLMENIDQYEENSGTSGYWLETPFATFRDTVWEILAKTRYVHYTRTPYSLGVRPVIMVPTTRISN